MSCFNPLIQYLYGAVTQHWSCISDGFKTLQYVQYMCILRGWVKAVSRRFISYKLLPFVIMYVMTLHPWKRNLHE